MSDILENVGVHVVCMHCEAEFGTRADVVARSQELLEEGCPGEHKECPARLFANFVDRDALRQLADAWERVRDSVHAPAVDIDLTASSEIKSSATPPPGDASNPSEARKSKRAASPAPDTVTFELRHTPDTRERED